MKCFSLLRRSRLLHLILLWAFLIHLQLLEQALNLILHLADLIKILLILHRTFIVLKLKHIDLLICSLQLLQYPLLLLIFLQKLSSLTNRFLRLMIAFRVLRLIPIELRVRLFPLLVIRCVLLLVLRFELLLRVLNDVVRLAFFCGWFFAF